VLHRPLVFVSGLTVADYLLWNWSLGGDHDVLTLVSGLTLPLLAAACLWLVALNVTRLFITRSGRRRSARSSGRGVRAAREHRHQMHAAAGAPLGEPSPTTSPGSSSSKLAA